MIHRAKGRKAGGTPHRRSLGNPRKRGSFSALVATLEGAPAEPDDPAVSGAAVRAARLIRTMRRSARLTQADLADRTGMTQSRISELEAGLGSHGPSWQVMERIASACGKTLGPLPDAAAEGAAGGETAPALMNAAN